MSPNVSDDFLKRVFLEVALVQPQQVEVLLEARCHADPQ